MKSLNSYHFIYRIMDGGEGFVMNLRGLPFAATEDDILKFFGEPFGC